MGHFFEILGASDLQNLACEINYALVLPSSYALRGAVFVLEGSPERSQALPDALRCPWAPLHAHSWALLSILWDSRAVQGAPTCSQALVVGPERSRVLLAAPEGSWAVLGAPRCSEP